VTDEPRKEQPAADAEMMFRVPRGAKGDKGDRGDAGMPPKVRRAVIFLFLLNMLLTVLLLFAFVHYVNSSQAAQRAEGQVIEQKLCATFEALAANKAPPGNPDTNPSRRYDQRNQAILSQVPADIECGRKTR
jgi:hypothetical protein